MTLTVMGTGLSAGTAPKPLLDPDNRVATFYPKAPVAFSESAFSFETLEQIIEDVAENARRDSRARVMCRRSAGAPEDASQAPVLDYSFRGRLENRLLNENIHIMITGVETYDAAAARLLTAFTTFVRDRCDGLKYGVFRPMATLFISSPGSIARLHNDPEHGWLSHLWGSKTFHVYPADEAHLNPLRAAAELRPLHAAEATRRFMEELRSREQVFHLAPGQAVFTPSLAPHWVKAGPQINLSLTFTCFTAASLMRQKVARLSELASRKGMGLQPYRNGGWSDRIKAGVFDVLEGMDRIKLV